MLFIGHVHGPGHVIHCHMILKDGRPSNVVDIRSSDVNVCPSRGEIYTYAAAHI